MVEGGAGAELSDLVGPRLADQAYEVETTLDATGLWDDITIQGPGDDLESVIITAHHTQGAGDIQITVRDVTEEPA